jgi:hypothetical protein
MPNLEFILGWLHFLAVGAIKFVMPANAGIQVRFRFEFQKRLYSGLRRNDGNMSQLPVDNADPFGLKSKLVQFHPAGIQSLCC